MQHRIVIDCPVKLRSMIVYARANNCTRELADGLLNLLDIASMYMASSYSQSEAEANPNFALAAEESNGSIEARIGADFAPMSLAFALFKDADTSNRRCTLAGGFIYEGPRQRGDGSAPALTVSLSPLEAGKHRWLVHT